MTVSELAARIVEHRGWFGSASRGSDLVEPPRGPGRIHNDTLRVPRSAPCHACSGDWLRRPTRYCDSLHPAPVEEAKIAAIRRPERKASVVGSRQDLCRDRIKLSYPQLSLALRCG